MQHLTTTGTRAFGRKRMLALAGLAGTALALGGLTACTDDGDKPRKDDSSQSKGDEGGETTDEENGADGEEDGGEDSEDGAGDEGTGSAGVFEVGETAVYDTLGVKFTISDPEVIEPNDEWDEWGGEGFTGYAFTVVIENEGDEPYDADMTLFQARAGEDGMEAEQIYSMDHLGEGVTGTALPGNKVTAKVGFNVPDGASPLIIELTELTDFDSQPAYWTYEF